MARRRGVPSERFHRGAWFTHGRTADAGGPAEPGSGTRATHYGRLSLDSLLLGRPDLLILSTRDDLTPSLAEQGLRHPGLAKAFPHLHTLVIPPRLWLCAGPWVVETIAQLRTAARRLAEREVPR